MSHVLVRNRWLMESSESSSCAFGDAFGAVAPLIGYDEGGARHKYDLSFDLNDPDAAARYEALSKDDYVVVGTVEQLHERPPRAETGLRGVSEIPRSSLDVERGPALAALRVEPV